MNTAVKKVQAEAPQHKSLIVEMAAKFHVEPAKFMDTLKSTAFKQKPGEEVTDQQMMMLLVVANEYNLNPFLKQIYAFPDKHKGIVPIVGVDGYIRIVNEHPQADGWEFRLSENHVDLDEFAQGIPEWMECIMHRKDRDHPTVARVYASESYRTPFTTKSGHVMKGPWQQYTRLMLENRAFIRAARFAFGFTGIYSEDDAERMQTREYIDAEVVEIAPDEAPVTADQAQDQFTEDAAEAMAATHDAPDLASILHSIETAGDADALDAAEDLINGLKGQEKSTAKATLANRRAEIEQAA